MVEKLLSCQQGGSKEFVIMWKVHLFLEISKILESRLMVNLLGKAA